MFASRESQCHSKSISVLGRGAAYLKCGLWAIIQWTLLFQWQLHLQGTRGSLLVFAQTAGYKGHPTDTLTSAGDNTRSGYLSSHNIDPNVLKSGTFDIIWRKKLRGEYNGFVEQFYAQPLVFTPKGESQRVYVISQQNIAYILDAITGDILVHRQLHIPFLVVPDLEGCNDVSDCVGSTSTGVIDPETATWYVTTKTYEDQTKRTPQGLAKGRYFVHGIDARTLVERPGFPIPLEGLYADNAPWRVFEGGKHHQRPALMQVGDWVYAGFGSHCVQWNFTGWVIGWHKETGKIVAKFAMEGGKEKSAIGGGVWMSGGGLASDNPGRMFFATGNGYASQLADDPVPGRFPPTALEEAVVNMAINGDGSLTPVDFFMPWEKRDLDAMDKDLGTSGFVLLDPTTFSTALVKRIGCVAGKTGKLYFLNLEDLGGYQMGPGRRDKVLQTVQMAAPVFSSAGSYPLEGGYVYITPVGKETVAYKFGKDASGMPVFTEAGKTLRTAAGRQGVGHGTVTSLNGEPGSGVLWITDVEGVNICAYEAVPKEGVLNLLLMLNNPGQSKFSRPTFGDGRVYLTTTSGFVTALGSPVNMPFNCSAPYDAGTVLIGDQTTTEIVCITKIPLEVKTISLDSTTHFSLSLPLPLPAALTQEATLMFKIVFKPSTVGPLGATVNIRTTNGGVQTYAVNTPVVIRGIAKSLAPILVIQPNVLSFGEIITGSNEFMTLDFALENVGEGAMTVQSYRWSTEAPKGPFIDGLASIPDVNGTYNNGPFMVTGLPKIGGKVNGNDRALVSVKFAPTNDGYFKLYLVIQTTGGTENVGAFGTAGSAPQAYFEWQDPNGKWIPYADGQVFSFGNVFLGAQEVRTMRLTNKGGTTLTTTISKPPVSGPLAALNGLGSLAEGSQLPPGKFEEAQLVCAPPKGQVNKDPLVLTAIWTFNNNDPMMGKKVIHFNCSGISPQVGPLQPGGRGRYRYIGCFRDADPIRRMDTQLYYSMDNTNGLCMTDCDARGYIFAATQYEGECWCGMSPALTIVPDTTCGYLCRGNYTEYCGGDGAYMSVFADEKRYSPGGGVTSTATIPTTTSSTPVIKTSSTVSPTPRPNFNYLGCVNEPTNGNSRALAKASYFSLSMTPKTCQDFCTTQGFPLSGTEYATECYCDSKLSSGSSLGGSSACTMPCGGDPMLICGGPNALSVYNNTALTPPREPGVVPKVGVYTHIGCYAEGNSGRALAGPVTISSTNMSVPFCISYCQAATVAGFKYAGIEYGVECYCGEKIENGAVKLGATLTGTGCDMTCPGDKWTYCGGAARLNVYSRED